MKFLGNSGLSGLSTTFLLLATMVPAASAQWFGDHVVQNGRTAVKGNLWTSQHVYYVGDELLIRLEFPRGYDLIASGMVEAHVVAFARGGSVFDIPIPADWGAAPRKLFYLGTIDIDELPEGQYQLGLVLTKPGGNAKNLDNWYGGFRAILDMEAIYVAATPIDSDDDIDGEHDDDTDRDGINGEEADEIDDDVVRKSGP